jgi:RHH-type transcriptional regulator, proline utilization regulon repressor / proline dehydrogenase / delta 1-pyrroline-5-carboxylate dehydrogenase
MISVVVGVQVFGGEALRHRPKTGGPRYLHRFASARTVSTDTAAVGGNATQLSSQEQG